MILGVCGVFGSWSVVKLALFQSRPFDPDALGFRKKKKILGCIWEVTSGKLSVGLQEKQMALDTFCGLQRCSDEGS